MWRIRVAVMALLTVGVVVALGPQDALASTKVELTYAGGKVAAPREAAVVAVELVYGNSETGTCYGTDEGGKVVKNPSATVTVDGSDTEVPELSCEALELSTGPEGETIENWVDVAGQITVKSVKIAATGKATVAAIGKLETLAKCRYEIKQLTGTQTFPDYATPYIAGTAALLKGSEPPGCAPSLPVTGIVEVERTDFEAYLASLV